MTYEHAIDWCERNIPMENYDSFSDWYEECDKKLATPALFENTQFNRMLENVWLDEFGSFEREDLEEQIEDAEQREIDTYSEPTVVDRPTIINQRVMVESKSPIRITPVSIPEDTKEEIRKTPIAVIIPESTPRIVKVSVLSRIRSSIISGIRGLFRRKK